MPVARTDLLERYGPDLRRRLNAASRLLTTLALRGLNQQVIDGRLPEAVGGEFVDANGLGGTAKRKPGPRIVVGYQDFAENETLAHLYAEALRARRLPRHGPRVGGLRQAAIRALRSGRIDLYPGYSGSLLEYLGGRSLRRALARIGAEPLALAQAQNRNVFATKTDTRTRGSAWTTISDLTRPLEPRAHAARRPAAGRAVGVRRGQRARPARAPGRSRRAPARSSPIVDSGTKLDHPDLAPNIWANFREVPGNGADDDGNGYVDDVYGVDLTLDAAPRRTSPTATGTARTSPGSSPRRPTGAASSASPRARRS